MYIIVIYINFLKELKSEEKIYFIRILIFNIRIIYFKYLRDPN